MWVIQALIAYIDPATIDEDKISHRKRWAAAVIEIRELSSEMWRVARRRRDALMRYLLVLLLVMAVWAMFQKEA